MFIVRKRGEAVALFSGETHTQYVTNDRKLVRIQNKNNNNEKKKNNNNNETIVYLLFEASIRCLMSFVTQHFDLVRSIVCNFTQHLSHPFRTRHTYMRTICVKKWSEKAIK